MTEIDLVVTPRDPVILRDGRPFGQIGTPQTGVHRWPRPSTLLGMARTYLGTLRSPDFFRDAETKAENIAAIRNVSLEWYLPAQSGEDEQPVETFLPPPADALAFLAEKDTGHLKILRMTPQSLRDGEATDIEWPGWEYPWLEVQEKPARETPVFWRWSQYKKWLETGKFDAPVSADELGLTAPETEERTHVAISPETGSAEDSRLFTTLGVRFAKDTVIAARLAVGTEDEVPERDIAALGGDRRPAFVRWGQNQVDWPKPPEKLEPGRGLRLFLISPAIFDAGWLPTWLEKTRDGNFQKVPGTDVRLRLRSACVPRWQPGHGWDMTIGKDGAPKPMRKLVPAGAVYFVEVDGDREEAMKTLWNRSLCENDQDRRDGLGRVLAGNWPE